jgi:adenylate cyclase
MATEDYRRKLTAILSMDVRGYSRLMGEDEAATVRTITEYRQVIFSLISDHHGRVVDSPGDNILAEFASVVDAVQCAVEIQKVLKVKNDQLDQDRRMEFRIGLNLGDVIEDEGRIYGDGVNIAARIESLAKPGGICISGTVHNHVMGKIAIEEEYIGEHNVKNIEKPVPVYRILMEPAAKSKIPEAKKIQIRRRRLVLLLVPILLVMVIGGLWMRSTFFSSSSPADKVDSFVSTSNNLPGRPSIAVLPFDNMSGDPEQEYFSDGITEDIITDLSKISALFVIARNSTFVYKGQAVDIQELGEELGAAYVLEGSVRKADDTVRITAQLLDAATGMHLWAERYDRQLDDVFAVQDEVVGEIVDALEVTLTEAELVTLKQDVTEDLEAYDLTKRGWWYYHQLTNETNDLAREMFDLAVELEPQYADAYVGLGFTHYEEFAQQWSQDPQSLEIAHDLAEQAIELDETQASAYSLLSHVYLRRGDHNRAIVEQERAITLDPNNANSYRDLAEALIFAGRPEEAIEHIKKAMRLNPHYPVTYPFSLGLAYTLIGYRDSSPELYDQAIAAENEAVSINPNFVGSQLVLAFIYNETGREQEARTNIAQALSINPQISLAALRESVPIGDPSMLEAFLESLQKAGLK